MQNEVGIGQYLKRILKTLRPSKRTEKHFFFKTYFFYFLFSLGSLGVYFLRVLKYQVCAKFWPKSSKSLWLVNEHKNPQRVELTAFQSR